MQQKRRADYNLTQWHPINASCTHYCEAHPPSKPFPNISGIHKLAGELEVAERINNSVTRNRFPGCTANAKAVSLSWERSSNHTEAGKENKLGRLNCISLLILLTCFLRELCEGLHSLLAIAALRGDGGDVSPAQGPDDVHHGLGLEGVGRNHPREEIVALVVTQLRGCRGVADLRNLGEKKTSWGLAESRDALTLELLSSVRGIVSGGWFWVCRSVRNDFLLSAEDWASDPRLTHAGDSIVQSLQA